MSSDHQLTELAKESRMGGIGSETGDREIRRIDVSDFDNRRNHITEELWGAALDVGFFQIYNHGIDLDTVGNAFDTARSFFELPDAVKGQYPHQPGLNAGWESRGQVRPSVGTPDQKESFQITRPQMAALWPTETELADFRESMLEFEARCWQVAMRVLSCFATKLGFDEDFFTYSHDPTSRTYQSTLRLLHYYPVSPEAAAAPGVWRAGAHTDFDCLTLLFQREGQGGLQVCPGREADGEEWTSIPPSGHTITCNIGDMLMRWSDDQLPSNFHRVRCPRPDEYLGSRYSMAFFAQANSDVLLQGPARKYAPITAGDYILERLRANFAATA